MDEELSRILAEISDTTNYKDRVNIIPIPVEVLETYTDNRPIKNVQLFRNIALFTPEEKAMVDKYEKVLLEQGNGWGLVYIVGGAYPVDDGWIIATLSESVLIVDLFDDDCFVFRIFQDPENPNKHNLVSIASSSEVSGCEWATVDVSYADGSFDKANEIYRDLVGVQRNIRKEVKDDNDDTEPKYLPS